MSVNPYKILNLDKGAAKQEIIRAGARAMRDRHYSAKEISLAQRALMDPVSGAIHEFLHFIEIGPLQDSYRERLQEKINQVRQENLAEFHLEYRPVRGKES